MPQRAWHFSPVEFYLLVPAGPRQGLWPELLASSASLVARSKEEATSPLPTSQEGLWRSAVSALRQRRPARSLGALLGMQCSLESLSALLLTVLPSGYGSFSTCSWRILPSCFLPIASEGVPHNRAYFMCTDVSSREGLTSFLGLNCEHLCFGGSSLLGTAFGLQKRLWTRSVLIISATW